MKSPSSSRAKPAHAQSVCRVAADFLRADDKMSGVLPTAARLIALQKDCKKMLPQLFEACAVMRLEEGRLMLSAPNSAVAARIKQTLPLLQEKLSNAGWQIDAIRVKVQVGRSQKQSPEPVQNSLSPQALSAFSKLRDQLASSSNQTLKEALGEMVSRHEATQAGYRK